MKKLLLSIIAVCFLLTGCESANNKQVDNSGESTAPVAKVAVKDGLNEPFTADGIEMKITDVTSSESVDQAKKPKQLITFTVEYKNIGTDDKGMGAIDFRLVTDKKDKAYSVTGQVVLSDRARRKSEAARICSSR